MLRWGKLAALAVVVGVAAGCAEDRTGPLLVTYRGSETGLEATFAAVHEWTAACGRELVTLVDAGGLPLSEVDTVDGAIGQTDIHDREPSRIRVMTAAHLNQLAADGQWSAETAMAAQRSVIAHELGHALGKGHDGIGIMREGADPSKHVLAANCPGGETAVHGATAPPKTP